MLSPVLRKYLQAEFSATLQNTAFTYDVSNKMCQTRCSELSFDICKPCAVHVCNHSVTLRLKLFDMA